MQANSTTVDGDNRDVKHVGFNAVVTACDGAR
jgi:hypothetical protein